MKHLDVTHILESDVLSFDLLPGARQNASRNRRRTRRDLLLMSRLNRWVRNFVFLLAGAAAQPDRTELPPVTLHERVPPIELGPRRAPHMNSEPHRGGSVRQLGEPLKEAEGAVVLLHGRGGSAEDILSLVPELYVPVLVYLAPQAAGNSWYPNSFLAPVSQNEPWLTSALRKVETALQMANGAGISADRIVMAGFSQGACLATEFVARYARRYAGLIAFTGGLIGPPAAD